MTRLFPVLLISACTSGTVGTTPVDSTTTPPDENGIRLTGVSINQAVEVPLVLDGTAVPSVDRVAPVVVGRPGVLVARVDVPDDWTARAVDLVVTLGGATHTTTATVAGDSTLGDPATWLVVDLPASAFTADAGLSVVLAGGSDRFPASGEADLDALVTGPLRMRVVPFDVDGSVPDTSSAVLDGMVDALFATYPVTDVEISVAPVEVWTDAFDLGSINVRTGEIQETAMWAGEVDWDVYHYGMTDAGVASREVWPDQPTGTSENGGEEPTRAFFAAGAAFGDERSESTLIHEVGHMHQLGHVSCEGTESDVDPGFPYDDGRLGVWGWDVRTGTFVDPATHGDLMGYCQPRWVSDHTYGRLAEHVVYAQTFNDLPR